MDFHALPRRDLQALCKRNCIRANMTNATMADALAALPAVDGIEEYIKQPAAPPTSAAKPAVEAVAEEEKKGTPLQLGRCSTFKPPDPITREDGEKEDGHLKRDENEDHVPARCAGRRGAGRRARPEPVAAAPATKRRGAGKKTEACDAAAEAMPVAELTPAAKPAADAVAEEETQGIPIPRFRCVTLKSPEPVMPEDSEKQDADEDDAPARGARRRGANWRARPEPVDAAPATRRRGAGKKTEACDAAAEAMLVAELTPAAKPTVDVVAEEEKQGIPIPRGRCVTFKSPEPVMPQVGEKSNGGLKQDENEDNAPALGAGRRGASRRARPEPVAAAPAPVTRRRAAASKTEAGVVAVPARTTRRRSQRMVMTEEEVLPAIRTTTRAAARKADIEQEEAGEGPQGVVSDAEITAPAPVYDEGRGDPQVAEQALDRLNEESNEVVEESSQECQADTVSGAAMGTPIPVEEDPAEECTDILEVQERHEDVQQCAAPLPNQEDSPTPVVLCLAEQGEEGVSSDGGPLYKEISHSTEMELVAISEAPQDTLTSREVTQEVGFTGDAAHNSEEEDEVVNFGEVNASEAGSEEKQDVAVVGVLPDTDEVMMVDLSGNITHAVVEEEVVVATEKMLETSETTEEAVEATIATADDMSQVTVTDGKDAGEENADEAGIEDVAVVEVLHDTVAGFDEISMVDLYGNISRAVVEEEVVVATEKMSEISETIEEAVEGAMVTADDVLQVTVTDREYAGKENADEAGTEENEDVAVVQVLHDKVAGFDESFMADLSGNINRGVVEEEVVVATENMPESSETMEESVEAMVTADNVSQVVTVTDEEDAGKENADEAFTEENEDMAVVEVRHDTVAGFDETNMADLYGNINRAVTEEEVVIATKKMPESSETMEEGVEAMVTADNVSQVVTVTDGEDTGKENASEAGTEEKDVAVVEVLHNTVAGFDEASMFDLYGNVSLAVVKEEVVVATEKKPESSETLEDGIEAMVTADNVSQLNSVTDGEDAGKESSFTGDLPSPPVFHSSRDFNDHITSPLSAGMLDDASLLLDSMIIVEPTMAENQDVSVCTYNNSGGEKMEQMPDDKDAGKESTFSSELPPVFDTSRDSSDVSLCVYNKSGSEKNVNEPVAVEQGKEVEEDKESPALGELTLRKLRLKLKETSRDCSDVSLCVYNNSGTEKNVNEPVAVEQGKEVEEDEESPALGELSLRNLRLKFKETSRDCSDVSLCVYNNSGTEKNVNEPVAVEQGKEVEEAEECPALGELSLRKLRMKLKDTSVAVEDQEKESKKSMALDKLSLRKLRIKLKETLTAQQRKGKRVALGRLDENVC